MEAVTAFMGPEIIPIASVNDYIEALTTHMHPFEATMTINDKMMKSFLKLFFYSLSFYFFLLMIVT